MDSSLLTWIWLALGVLLGAAELALPGLVVVFLGMAALIVSGLCGIGLVQDAALSIVIWMTTSVFLVLALRRMALKWFPPEVRKDSGDEDLDAYGQTVTVVEECREEGSDGRIRFQGTTWPATCTKSSIPAGQKARLLYRDNLVWVIEPIDIKDEQKQLEEQLERDIIG